MIKGLDSSRNAGFRTSEYKSTGVYSVDLLLNAHGWYKKANRAVKEYILSKYHYDKMHDYFMQNYIKDSSYDPNEPFRIENIPILRAESSLIDDIYVTFWPEKRSEKDDEKFGLI